MAAPSGSGNEIIDLSGDTSSESGSISVHPVNVVADEDRDLNKAIALSLQSMPRPSPPEYVELCTVKGSNGSSRDADCDTTVKPRPGGILGMDRRKQEEERLARLKRKREKSVSPPASAKRCAPTAGTANHGGAKAYATTDVSSEGEVDGLESGLHRSSSPLKYPEGVVKQTWAFGFKRKDDIKIDEVLERSKLEAAVLSAFQWDWEWLLPKMDTRRTKFVFVVQAKEETIKQQYRTDFSGVANVRLCFPPMQGQVKCMHSKLMLLFYPTHLRIAIPTANLVPYDWGEPFGMLAEGVMENTVFLIDLPKRDPDAEQKSDAEIPFLQSLLYFVTAMGLQKDVIKKLQTFDFSKLAHYGFIHSIGGAHHGDTWKKTGMCGLGEFLNKLGLRTTNSVQIDYVTSSLGSVDDEYLRALYLIAQGDSGLSEYTLRTGKSIPPGILQDLQRRVGEDFSFRWKHNLRIYFPSDETVRRSKGGANCAGTICFQSRWWHGPKFPRGLVRDCRSRREGLLMHNKMWCTQYKEPVSMKNGRRALGWAYVGSANLSESAWGRLVQDRATKAPKLSCRNWECGVVLPVMLEQDHGSGQHPAKIADVGKSHFPGPDHCLGMFKNVLPIPMVVPGKPYPTDGDNENHDSNDDTKQMIPWFSF